jgi:hypothetical protein
MTKYQLIKERFTRGSCSLPPLFSRPLPLAFAAAFSLVVTFTAGLHASSIGFPIISMRTPAFVGKALLPQRS